MGAPQNNPPVVPPAPPELSRRRVFVELLILGAAGLAVFLYEGFRAHPGHPRTLSDDPLALFAWLVLLMLEAESLAVRVASREGLLLGRWAKGSLYAFTVAVALVAGVARIAPHSRTVAGGGNVIGALITSGLTGLDMNRQQSLNVVNFLLLAPFVLLIVVRIVARIWRGIFRRPRTTPSLPAWQRLVADLLTLAIVSLCVSALMNQFMLSSITANLQHPIGGLGHGCDLALAATSCDPSTGPQPLATLTAMDAFFVPAACIVVATFIVTMAAVWNALKSLKVEAFVGAFVCGLMAELSLRLGLANILMWVRLLWWLPIVVAAAAATEVAFAAQRYLVGVIVDDTPPGQLGGLLFFDPYSAIYSEQFAAVELAAVMVIAIHSAVSLLLVPGLKKSKSQSVTDQRKSIADAGRLWRQGIWLTAVVLLLVYGVFSFLLWLINALIVGIWNVRMPHAHVPTPFIQPDFLALFAAAVFCCYAIRRLVHHCCSRSTTPAAPAGPTPI